MGRWRWALLESLKVALSTVVWSSARKREHRTELRPGPFTLAGEIQTCRHGLQQASLSITSSQSLLKLMSIKSVMPSSHLILCHPLLLLPSIFPSIRVFSSESFLHIRWPKYLNFSFSISPSNEYSGLISFKMQWLELLAVQGTLKSLFQYHSSKASVFGSQFSLWSNSHIHM